MINMEENGIDRKKLRVSDDEKMMYQINCSEKNRNYTSLETEQAWLNAVKRGDLSFVEEGELNWKVTGEMAKSSLKQLEYGCVCMITLLTRAAMEAGVPAVEAYNISDMYLQKLEKCVAQSEINVLIHNAYEAFQERIVREQERLEIPYYITTCKDYIAQHRTRDIHVSDLVKAVGVSHSYLSKKFKEFEGITLREYMLQEKINAAANMIRYSDRSLSEIAEYLNFSSQSHMGQCFRKKFDMTPQEYRRKYREI